MAMCAAVRYFCQHRPLSLEGFVSDHRTVAQSANTTGNKFTQMTSVLKRWHTHNLARTARRESEELRGCREKSATVKIQPPRWQPVRKRVARYSNV